MAASMLNIHRRCFQRIFPVFFARHMSTPARSTRIFLPIKPNIAGSSFHTQSGALFNGEFEMKDPLSEDEVVNITYIDKNGQEVHVRGKVGDNLMYLAHRYNIELEGACEASLACSTCHVYVDNKYFDQLPESLDEEEDMLDMAAALKPNSRLGCQIILNKELEGLIVTLPPITRNFYVDGHVPQPH